MQRKCENNQCIYQNNGKCVLKMISVDSAGKCTKCVLVGIPKKEMDEIQEKVRAILKRKDDC